MVGEGHVRGDAGEGGRARARERLCDWNRTRRVRRLSLRILLHARVFGAIIPLLSRKLTCGFSRWSLAFGRGCESGQGAVGKLREALDESGASRVCLKATAERGQLNELFDN